MKVVREIAPLRTLVREARGEGRTIGLVPTMGALHEGHLSLIRAAQRETDFVIVSIFVNPKQFGPSEDFETYPRDEARDLEMAAAAGADLIFAPSADSMYPEGFSTTVEVTGLTDVLCGADTSRGSAHFKGVTTVVCKLLNATAPDNAYFGQKDAQQVAVIKRMVRDLDMPVEIRVMPTVREADGLAMSSRNRYLSDEDRERSVRLNEALSAVRDGLAAGEDLADLLAAAKADLASAGIEIEYLEARDPESLEPIETLDKRPVLVAIAAQIGPARLIDNIIFDPQADLSTQQSLAMQGGPPR